MCLGEHFHLLIHSPRSCDGWSRARPKPGHWNVTQGSLMSARDTDAWVIVHFPRWRYSWIEVEQLTLELPLAGLLLLSNMVETSVPQSHSFKFLLLVYDFIQFCSKEIHNIISFLKIYWDLFYGILYDLS